MRPGIVLTGRGRHRTPLANDGTRTFPIGTGLVHMGRGDHALRFELAPCGSVEGFVRGDEGSALRVALAREGRLLALDVRREELAVLGELGACPREIASSASGRPGSSFPGRRSASARCVSRLGRRSP